MDRNQYHAIMNKGLDYNTFIDAVQSLVIENHRRYGFMISHRAGARAALPAHAPCPEVRWPDIPLRSRASRSLDKSWE